MKTDRAAAAIEARAATANRARPAMASSLSIARSSRDLHLTDGSDPHHDRGCVASRLRWIGRRSQNLTHWSVWRVLSPPTYQPRANSIPRAKNDTSGDVAFLAVPSAQRHSSTAPTRRKL
jgi:hypothetical protein